jgi:hypothetical protein
MNDYSSGYTMEMYDVSGKMLQSWLNIRNDLLIHTESLPKGVYLIKAISEDKIYSTKMVKE